MIPRDYITEWREHAPWVQDFQVEQDLVISRALVDIFSHPVLRESLAFRGGTALYKLHLPPARYSEDIDLVQIAAAPAGPIMGALREVLDSWLGEPRWRQNQGRITFSYRFASEDVPPIPLRLKVEINSREHFNVFELTEASFAVNSRWHEGQARIIGYELDELLGTKLRALYQRRKGRDLFDMATALDRSEAAPARIIQAFSAYMEHGDHHVTRAQFEQNLANKLRDPQFGGDVEPLLAADFSWDMEAAARNVGEALIERLPGEAWQGKV